jgi:enoyl-CoA hydratase
MVAALEEALAASCSDVSIKLAVLTGAGTQAFASGGDLAELSSIRTPDAAVAMAERFRAVFDAVRKFPAPVIAALNGDALGGGAELAMACDMRIAASHARFSFLQGKLSITSAWGGGADLIAAVGVSRALRMMGMAEILSAETARGWGIVEAVAPEDVSFDDFIDDFTRRFDGRIPTVMRAFKAMAAAHRFGASRDQLVRLEAANFAQVWVHDDHWAAVEASSGLAGIRQGA